MIIADKVKSTIESFDYGVVFTVEDFDIEKQYQLSLVKSLNRYAEKGILQKISKGKYFKPKTTIFGKLNPSSDEIVKDLLEKGGKTVGYVTGISAFASMGLTTQITSALLIGSNKYRRPISRGEYKVTFLLQRNEITKDTIPLLRILDAIKLIKEIPATTPDETINSLKHLIRSLSCDKLNTLCALSEKYTPSVRAILGAILESLNLEASRIKDSLNWLTYYKLPISNKSLPNKSNWNIL